MYLQVIQTCIIQYSSTEEVEQNTYVNMLVYKDRTQHKLPYLYHLLNNIEFSFNANHYTFIITNLCEFNLTRSSYSMCSIILYDVSPTPCICV